jgi:hypothetical protein
MIDSDGGMSLQDWNFVFVPLLITSTLLQVLGIIFGNDCNAAFKNLLSCYLLDGWTLASLTLMASLSEASLTSMCPKFVVHACIVW